MPPVWAWQAQAVLRQTTAKFETANMADMAGGYFVPDGRQSTPSVLTDCPLFLTVRPSKNGTSPALRIRLSRPRKPCHPAITGGRFKRVRSGQSHVCRPSLGPVRQSIAAICPCPARWVGHPPAQTCAAPARRVRAMKFPRGWYRAKRFVVCPGHAKRAEWRVGVVFAWWMTRAASREQWHPVGESNPSFQVENLAS